MERQHIEEIVIASLIADFTRRWPDVRTALAEDCIRDPLLKSTYHTIRQQAAAGLTPNFATVTEGLTAGDHSRIAEIVAEKDFSWLKWKYNRHRYWSGRPVTDVRFADYVNKLIG